MITQFPKQNILLLTQSFPFLAHAGGAVRISYNFIKYLGDKYHITLLTYDTGFDAKAATDLTASCCEVILIPEPTRSKYDNLLSMLTLTPSTVSRSYSYEMQNAVIKLLKRKKFDLVYADRLAMGQFIAGVDVPTIVASIDAMSLYFSRRARFATNFLQQIAYKWEAKRLQLYEKNVLSKFGGCSLVSYSDEEYLKDRIGLTNVFVAALGIDTTFFSPMADSEPEKAVIFTGIMDYAPNVDAAVFLIKDIMPLLWAKHSDLKVFVVGMNPTDAIKDLSCDRVIVTGFVDDLRQYLASASIYVSPLRFGTGVKNKVLEAMAMGLPVVGTSITFEGLDVLKPAAKVADTPTDIANAVDFLLRDQTLAKQLGLEGYSLVERKFGWDETFNIIRGKIASLTENHSSKGHLHQDDIQKN